MQKSAENVPAEVDEFEHAGLTPIDSKTVQTEAGERSVDSYGMQAPSNYSAWI